MSDRTDLPPAPDRPRTWLVPLAAAVLVAVAIAILVVSNPDSVPIAWAGLEWEAPLWLVLIATFAAGGLMAPLIVRLSRTYGRRRRRRRAEYRARQSEYRDAVKRAEDDGRV